MPEPCEHLEPCSDCEGTGRVSSDEYEDMGCPECYETGLQHVANCYCQSQTPEMENQP